MYGVLWASPNTGSAVHRAERMGHGARGLKLKKNRNTFSLHYAHCSLPFAFGHLTLLSNSMRFKKKV